MTDIQLKFWAQNEVQRHNYATEAQAASELQETRRHNVVTETETTRHNRVSEIQVDRQIVETQRHNRVTEDETTRHNLQQETLGFQSLNETRRHNRAYESETARHNRATESATSRQIAVSERQASASERQAAVAERNVSVSEDRAQYQNRKDLSSVGQNQASTQKTYKETSWIDRMNESNLSVNRSRVVGNYAGAFKDGTTAIKNVAGILK